ncbi:MAG: hypothetical protein OJF49_003592 [Ktedonobacterales bacterium]|jgi:tetratricopeptide (TPR) repeat protein|nr:MAG: hypothetical protein OJF49_003592 [Ktedonobacterales bacterium]
MDALQFGRWLSERRRLHGWTSQRALTDAANAHPEARAAGISEAFLARLEAGLLAHPFRGSVRTRVLALAWLFCATPRQAQAYLRAAELTDLSSEENEQVERLLTHLAAAQHPGPLVLPVRPQAVIGRDAELRALIEWISSAASGFGVMTGMPGLGKSALAAEALHQIAANPHQHLRLFPDGIVTLTATGRRGIAGLLSLLRDVATLFRPDSPPIHTGELVAAGAGDDGESDASSSLSQAALTQAINDVRALLAQKRVLIFLDDVEPDIPWRQLVEALVSENATAQRGAASPGRVVLVTSRYVPNPPLMAYHLPLAPLTPEASITYLEMVMGRALSPEEREYARQIGAYVGHVPLAIETAASAARLQGLPLPLLATHLAHAPFDALLDGESELHTRLAHAVNALSPEARQRLALLSWLGTHPFGLEAATALERAYSDPGEPVRAVQTINAEGGALAGVNLARVDTADIAASSPFDSSQARATGLLGTLVRHSLVVPVTPVAVAGQGERPESDADQDTRFRLPPLVRAYAAEAAAQVEPSLRLRAGRGIVDYALAYLDQHGADMAAREREHALLLAATYQAWQLRQHSAVLRLVGDVAPMALRVYGGPESERIVGWGLRASQELHDALYEAKFLNRLGVVQYYQGFIANARRSWEAALEHATTADLAMVRNYVLMNLSILGNQFGEPAAAWRYADQNVRQSMDAESPCMLAMALMTRATAARMQGKLDAAYADASAAAALLGQPATDPELEQNPLFLEIWIEIARTQRDFTQSQHYFERLIPVIRKMHDPYTVSDMLLEQGESAYQLGAYPEALALGQQGRAEALTVHADFLRKRGDILLQHVHEAMRTRARAVS